MTHQTDEEKVVCQWLWKYGHFRNPKKAESLNVKHKDLSKLCCKDRAYREAVESIQELDYNLEYLIRQQHGENRVLQMDGDVGPATMALLDLPRCGHPDYGEAQEAELVGSGGWPSCDPDQDHAHSIRVRIETDNMPSKFKAYLDEVLALAVQCCSRIGILVTFFVDPNEPRNSFNGYQYWTNIPGSVIGVNMLPSPNTCNQTVWGKMDRAYVPDSPRQAARLQIHEMEGHGIGLGHYRGGIMNPSIIWKPDEDPTYVGDPAYNRLAQMYGGKQVYKKEVRPWVTFW